MSFKRPIFFSIIIIALFFIAANPSIYKTSDEDLAEKETLILRSIMAGLDQLHFHPKQVDDQFSDNVFKLYLERIDRNKRFLTFEDYNRLVAYQYKIDDQINAGDYTFFDMSVEIVENSLRKTQKIYREILAKPFDLNAKGSIELDPDKRKYAETDNELKQVWQTALRYETMTRVAGKLKRKAEIKEKAGKIAESSEDESETLSEEEEELMNKTTEEIEEDARKSVLKRYDDWYHRLFKLDRSDRHTTYLNAITSIYDPHTNYLEPIEKQTFDMRMSGRLEGIGAQLMLDGDFTKVSSIVPGGPAWSGGELEKDDVILKVAQDDDEPNTVVGLLLDDVVSQIRGKKGTKVRLTIRKKDGTEKEISIIRDVIIFEEGYAKSLLLEVEEKTDKLGYIFLPKFYGDFQTDNGRLCSEDVGKEIVKLRKEGAKGIILDLRSNGGGYLEEVIKMTGLFIEDGPVVQEKPRARKAIVRRDEDESVLYEGPLVVLVNEFSASASEIIAAALQDYGRAVIVGSKSTYGKGTVQRFLDLDQAVRGNNELKPLGELRITIRKYYRIDGSSVQLKGVVPDVFLPDNYEFIEVGEKDQEFPLEWTEIEPSSYKLTANTLTNIDELKVSSESRVSASKDFQLILENAKRIKALRDETMYPVSIDDYQQFEKDREQASKKYENIMEDKVDGLAVVNLKSDMKLINESDENQKRNEEFVESVEKDIYIEEALYILQDLIEKDTN